jgi:hypothetical protein
MRAFIIIEQGHPMLVAELETTLIGTLRDLQITGTANWYYDDDNSFEPTEYGVKLEIANRSAVSCAPLLKAIFDYCAEKYGEVRMEIS